MGSLAAFVLIVLAGKITPSVAPPVQADPNLYMDQIAYTPVVDTHLAGLVIEGRLASEAQLVRFEPGEATPRHSHSRPYVGLLVTGAMKDPFTAARQGVTIGPGTYWYVPAQAKHVTACVSEKPCLAYVRFGQRRQR